MKHRSLIIVLACLAFVAPRAAAQAGAGGAAPLAASAEAALGLKGTRLQSQSSLLFGGDVRLGIARALSIGGAGWVLSGSVDLTSDAGGSDLLLDLAYGGVILERAIAEGETPISLRITLGAGNAKVTLAGVGTEIAADNFGVIEPEVAFGRRLSGFLELRGFIGYRLVFGVDDLPQLRPSDLRGASLAVALLVRSR